MIEMYISYLHVLYFRYVWPKFGHKMAMQHDAYLCRTFYGAISWPTQRLEEANNFVGSAHRENAYLQMKCPIECRRHEERKYC